MQMVVTLKNSIGGRHFGLTIDIVLLQISWQDERDAIKQVCTRGRASDFNWECLVRTTVNLRFLAVSSVPLRKSSDCLELGHNPFLSYASYLLFTNHPTVRRSLVWATNSFVKWTINAERGALRFGDFNARSDAEIFKRGCKLKTSINFLTQIVFLTAEIWVFNFVYYLRGFNKDVGELFTTYRALIRMFENKMLTRIYAQEWSNIQK
jgi:hypothetical protein